VNFGSFTFLCVGSLSWLEKMEMWQNVRLDALAFIVGFSAVPESRGLVAYNDLHVLRWLRYQSAKLQTYYKLKRNNRTFKFAPNQQLAQTCCYWLGHH